MSKLIDSLNQMLEARTNTCESMIEAERRFLETLVFSDIDEIVLLLDIVHERYLLEYPVWAHLITYRLACLLQPNNSEIRRNAVFWIRFFGPDWNGEANKLEDEARNIDAKLDSSNTSL